MHDLKLCGMPCIFWKCHECLVILCLGCLGFDCLYKIEKFTLLILKNEIMPSIIMTIMRVVMIVMSDRVIGI